MQRYKKKSTIQNKNVFIFIVERKNLSRRSEISILSLYTKLFFEFVTLVLGTLVLFADFYFSIEKCGRGRR